MRRTAIPVQQGRQGQLQQAQAGLLKSSLDVSCFRGLKVELADAMLYNDTARLSLILRACLYCSTMPSAFRSIAAHYAHVKLLFIITDSLVILSLSGILWKQSTILTELRTAVSSFRRSRRKRYRGGSPRAEQWK